MLIESADVVEHPADAVYRLVRDDMQRLVPHMPNIDRIQQIQRQESDPGPRIVNHWHAKTQLPAIAMKFVSPEIQSWVDTAQWNDAGQCVDYQIVGLWRPDLYTCRGNNSFRPLGEGQTEVRIRVELNIHADRLPGVPRLIAGRIVPAVEEFVRRLLKPNLTSLAKGLQSYVKEQKT